MDVKELMQEYAELEEEERAILSELEELEDVKGCIVPKEIPHKDKKYEYYYSGLERGWKNEMEVSG